MVFLLFLPAFGMLVWFFIALHEAKNTAKNKKSNRVDSRTYY